jgi:glycosyltransferase involved in cell wall biosynthesis
VRILMIAPEPFLEPRGTPLSVYHRAKALVTLGYEVDLVTYPLGEQVRLAGLRIYRAPALPFLGTVKVGPSLAKFPLDLGLLLTACWRLCRRRYRFIHTHEEAGLMGVVLAALFGCRHLYDMHSDLAQQMANFAFTRSPLLIRWVAALQRLIVRRADAVIAICPDLEQTVKRIAPAKAVCLIENVAVDEALPPAQPGEVELIRQRWGLAGRPVVLYTGTFERYQGIELLLRSAALLRPAFPEARYVLVGGKPEQVEQQRLRARQLGIEPMVCLVGERPLGEMPGYLGLADILVSPRSEGTNTPLKLYTYLRSGKPILATDISSHSQILSAQVALLVPPTAEGLARGARDLLQNPGLARRLGANGRSMAEKKYSWPVFLAKTGRAYGEFTGKPADGLAAWPRQSNSKRLLLLRRKTCVV